MASYNGGSVTAHIGADISDYQSAMRAVSSSTSKTMGGAAAATSSTTGKFSLMNSTVGQIAAGVGAVTLVSKGIGVLKDSVGSAVARFDTLNAYPKVMKQMGYSTQDTNKSVGILKKGVDGLPTSLQDLTQSAQSFAILEKSATKGAQTATALNDAFLASGASAGDASRGVEQYSQMLASGSVDLQSWKTLQETMPYALTTVAKSFGLTGKSAERDLYAKLKSGDITMDQLNKRFVELDGGMNGFANTARTATGGIGTSFTNMKNAVTNGLANTITAVDNGLKSAGITNGIAGIFNQAKQIIVTSFVAINGVIQGAMPAIVGIFSTIGNVINTVLAPALSFAKVSFSDFITGSIAAFAPLTSKLQGMGKEISTGVNLSSIAASIAGVVSQVVNVLTILRNAVADVITGFVNTGAVQSAWNNLVAVFNVVVTVIKLIISVVGNVIGSFSSAGSSVSIWQTIGTVIGSVAVVIGNVISFVANLVTAFLSMSGVSNVISTIVIGIAGMAVVFGTVLGVLKAIQIGFTVYSTAVRIATGVQAAFNLIMSLNPFVIIGVAIVALIAGITLWITQTKSGQAAWQAFTSWIQSAWSGMVSFFSGIWTGITSGVSSAGQFIQDTWNTAKNFVTNLWNGIGDFFTSVWNSITATLAPVGTFFSDTWNNIVTNLSGIWNGIVGIATGVWGLIKDAIMGPVLLVLDLITGDFKQLGTDAQNIWNDIVTNISTIWQNIVDVATKIFNLIKNAITNIWNTISATTVFIWNSIVSAVTGIWNGFINGATTFATGLWTGIKNIWNSIPGWISGLWTGVKNTISGLWTGIKAGISNAASASFNGLKNAWNGLIGFVSNLWNGVKKAIHTAMHFDLLGAGKAIMNSFFNGLKAVWGGIQKFFSGIAPWVRANKGPISYDRRLLIPAGKAIMEGFGGSLNNNFEDVKRSVSSYAGQIADQFGHQEYEANAQLTASSVGVAGQINGGLNALSDEVAEQSAQAPTFYVHNELVGDKITTTVNSNNSRRQNINNLIMGGGI